MSVPPAERIRAELAEGGRRVAHGCRRWLHGCAGRRTKGVLADSPWSSQRHLPLLYLGGRRPKN
jgi:hypothetical protein